MPKLKITIIYLVIIFLLQSCKLWPYRSDFDCPVSEGYKCKSLYEINNLVDKGAFERNLDNESNESDNLDNLKCTCHKM